MNANLLTNLGEPLTQLTYSILVEKETEGSYKATVWGLADCQGIGETKESAIANLRHHLKARLEKAEVVSQEIPLSKLTYAVILEEKEGNYQATVWGLPEIQATGEIKEAVLKSINQLLTARLEKVEVISDQIDLPAKSEHPWMKFAGKYKDDPLFDDMLAEIEAYRRELDAKMEAYERQLQKLASENPWSKFSGMYKDNPLFNDMVAEVEAYRRELDAEMEEYYRQMDAVEENK